MISCYVCGKMFDEASPQCNHIACPKMEGELNLVDDPIQLIPRDKFEEAFNSVFK